MGKVYERTVQEFVEDLLSDGRSASHILLIAKFTQWAGQIGEVKQILKDFCKKLGKRF